MSAAMFRICRPACGWDSDVAAVELRLAVTPPRNAQPTSEPGGDDDFDLW